MNGFTYSQAYDMHVINKDKSQLDKISDFVVMNQFEEKERNYILSLPLKNRRMAILSILEKDRKIFTEIKSLVDKSINKTDHLIDVVTKFKQYIIYTEVAKKEGGEVMTPVELVDEMLDLLPKEIWSNPSLKWLDPANGCGVFLVCILIRLMNGLSDRIIDEKERYKYIIENMLYACELQDKNMFSWCFLIDPYYEYNPNVYQGSYLDEHFDNHMKNIWNVTKFDVIVGNPPYNDPFGLKGGGNNLYSKFIEKSLNMLNSNGFLSFVSNAGFLKPTGSKKNKIIDRLLSGNLMFLNINECKKHFPKVGCIFCYFVFQNNKKYNQTKCCTQLDKNCAIYTDDVDLSKLDWIPRVITKETINIIKKMKNNDVEFIRIDDVQNHTEITKNMVGFRRLNHLVKPYKVNATTNIDKGSWILIKTDNKDKYIEYFNSKLFSFINVIYRYDPIIYHKMLNKIGFFDNNLNDDDVNFINNFMK